jgi:CheY-like chemotaxis protein
VEDEPLVALDMVAGLEQRGAEIMGSVDNTLVALALIKNTRLDPARLDANLGGRPVDDIAAALTRQHVQLVFVTGYGQEILPQAFAVAPMLSKPFSQRQLLDAAGIVQRPADGITLRN